VRDVLEDVYMLTENLIKTNKAWREHAKIYSELAKVISVIPYELLPEVYDKFVPNLVILLKNGAE